MAFFTARVTSGFTDADWLSTRDTVDFETPASFATSKILLNVFYTFLFPMYFQFGNIPKVYR